MNNSVKNGYGQIIGFKCWTCGEVYDSMWGTKCNKCRRDDNENDKLRAEIRRLSESIESLKK